MKANPYESLLTKLAQPSPFDDSHREALSRTTDCRTLKDWNQALLSLC